MDAKKVKVVSKALLEIISNMIVDTHLVEHPGPLFIRQRLRAECVRLALPFSVIDPLYFLRGPPGIWDTRWHKLKPTTNQETRV